MHQADYVMTKVLAESWRATARGFATSGWMVMKSSSMSSSVTPPPPPGPEMGREEEMEEEVCQFLGATFASDR